LWEAVEGERAGWLDVVVAPGYFRGRSAVHRGVAVPQGKLNLLQKNTDRNVLVPRRKPVTIDTAEQAVEACTRM
jgi:hypothetical protein